MFLAVCAYITVHVLFLIFRLESVPLLSNLIETRSFPSTQTHLILAYSTCLFLILLLATLSLITLCYCRGCSIVPLLFGLAAQLAIVGILFYMISEKRIEYDLDDWL